MSRGASESDDEGEFKMARSENKRKGARYAKKTALEAVKAV